MTDSIESALSLLFIGMITVFVVLSLVVLIGNVLIYFINKYFSSPPEEDSIDPKKVAAITAAVEVVTEGKGQINKIQKL